MLTTKYFPVRHTAANIAKSLKDHAEEFDILDKVPCVVHDQASNMKAAVRELKEIAEDDDAENNPPSDVESDSSGESEDVDRDDQGGDAEAGRHQEADLQSGEGSEDDVDESDEESHMLLVFRPSSVPHMRFSVHCKLV